MSETDLETLVVRSEAHEALDVLISDRRAELEHLRSRLDRADSKASGVINATFAAGTVAVAGFAAMEQSVPWWSWPLLAVAICLLLGGLILALAVRDTSHSAKTIGRKVAATASRIHKETGKRMRCTVSVRQQLRDLDTHQLPAGSGEANAQTAVLGTLVKRIDLTVQLRELVNTDAQLAAIGLALGVVLLVAAAFVCLLTG